MRFEHDDAANNPGGAAWAMVALVPVMFVVGLLVVYALEGLLAPDTVGDQRALLPDLLGVLVVAVLVLLPALVAWRLGTRAEILGHSRAPRLTGAALAGAALLAVVVQVVVNAWGGHY